MANSSISMTIPNLVGIQMYYIPPEIVDPEAVPVYQNWNANVIIDEVENRIQYDTSTNPDNVLLYSWNMEYQEPSDTYENLYFTIENKDTSTIELSMIIGQQSDFSVVDPSTDLSYSYNLSVWTHWDNVDSSINLDPGQKVFLKGNNINNLYWDYYEGEYVTGIMRRIKTNGYFDVYGNTMSLFYEDDFKNKTALPHGAAGLLNGLFKDSSVISAKNLVLPADKIDNQSCYATMFAGCSSLTEAPELPATELTGGYCYGAMFLDCSLLTKAPELPSTELSYWCYERMFYGCLSLTEAPELPATELTDECYYQMFYGCLSLTEAPELPATTLSYRCYQEMFRYCRALTTPPELPATILIDDCYKSMFEDCRALTTPPELPATTLADSCYQQMFTRCISLTAAPELPATTLATACYMGMFEDCRALTTPPELPATTLVLSCYYDMFRNCLSLTTAPDLPATTLVRYCYYRMFQNCSSLNYVKAMFTGLEYPSYELENYTYNWLFGVSVNGTFVYNAAAPFNPEDLRGESGIPLGWTVQAAYS